MSVFSITVGNRLGRTNYVKRTWVKQLEPLKSISTEEFFLGMFQNFQKSSFSEHPLKKYNVGGFLETWIVFLYFIKLRFDVPFPSNF